MGRLTSRTLMGREGKAKLTCGYGSISEKGEAKVSWLYEGLIRCFEISGPTDGRTDGRVGGTRISRSWD